MYGPRARSGYQYPGSWKNADVVRGRAAWSLGLGVHTLLKVYF